MDHEPHNNFVQPTAVFAFLLVRARWPQCLTTIVSPNVLAITLCKNTHFSEPCWARRWLLPYRSGYAAIAESAQMPSGSERPDSSGKWKHSGL